VTLKPLVTGVAAAAVVSAAAAGVTSIASGASLASAPAVAPVVFDVPLPLAPPAADVTAELKSVLYGLADPNVRFKDKGYLVEGGVGFIEGRTADRVLSNANAQGKLPLSFDVAPPRLSPDGLAATATVTASGPQTSPVSQDITFVNPTGNQWQLSKASATSLLTTFSA